MFASINTKREKYLTPHMILEILDDSEMGLWICQGLQLFLVDLGYPEDSDLMKCRMLTIT